MFDIGTKGRLYLADGSYIIPDGLNLAQRTLSEIKNVAKLALTKQLRTYLAYAESNGLKLQLFVRQGTVLTGRLEKLAEAGGVTVIRVLK